MGWHSGGNEKGLVTICFSGGCCSQIRLEYGNILFSQSNYIRSQYHTTVNNKKTHPPCFSTFRFSLISPGPLELKKNLPLSFCILF